MTASAPSDSFKKALLGVVLLCSVITGVIGGFWLKGQPVEKYDCALTIPVIIGSKTDITPRDCVTLERATTLEQRRLGLSGRERMAPMRGMLFVFDQPNDACMWMKDMKFTIDMVWLDADKKITKILKNVTPETYPESFCADNTKYVIELNAGTADRAGLSVGMKLTI